MAHSGPCATSSQNSSKVACKHLCLLTFSELLANRCTHHNRDLGQLYRCRLSEKVLSLPRSLARPCGDTPWNSRDSMTRYRLDLTE